MTPVDTTLQNALLVDFTGTAKGFKQLKTFDDEFVKLIRDSSRPKVAVVIDRAVGTKLSAPVIVRDHINFTGTSPLLGPNDPVGERFPVVQGIYIEDQLTSLKRVVVGGLKSGVVPDAKDWEFLSKHGVEACSYHVVLAMLVAAHARCKVLAVLIPEDGAVTDELLNEISKLTGAAK